MVLKELLYEAERTENQSLLEVLGSDMDLYVHRGLFIEIGLCNCILVAWVYVCGIG